MEQALRLERFDHLARSPDPEIQKVSKQLRSLTLNVYRNYMAHFELYSSHGKWASVAESGLPSLDRYHNLLDRLDSKARSSATGSKLVASGGYWDLNRQFHSTPDIYEKTFDSDMYERTLKESMKENDKELEKLRMEASKSLKKGVKIQSKSEEDMIDLHRARRLLQDRIEQVWGKSIFPKLREVSGADKGKPLVEFGDPWKVAPKGPIRFGSNFGSVCFRNISAQTLNHVAIAILLESEEGGAKTWYGYLPVLGPGQFAVASYSGAVFFPFGTRASIPEAGSPLKLTLSLFADEGCDQGRSVTLIDTPAADSATPFPRSKVGSKDDESIALEWIKEQRLGRYPLGEFAKKAPVNSARYDKQIMRLVEKYPEPVSPSVATARLLEKLRISQDHEFKLDDDDPPQKCRIVVDPVLAQDSKVHARIEFSQGKKITKTIGLIGRLAPEPGRGTVVALTEDENAVVAEARQRMNAPKGDIPPSAPLPPASKKSKVRPKAAPSIADRRAKNQEEMIQKISAATHEFHQRFLAGKVPTLTDFEDVKNPTYLKNVNNLITPTMNPADISGLDELRSRLYVPKYVLAIDENGSLVLQSNSPADAAWVQPLDVGAIPKAADVPEATFKQGVGGDAEIATKLELISRDVMRMDFQNIPERRRLKVAAVRALEAAARQFRGGVEGYKFELENARADLNALLNLKVSEENKKKIEEILGDIEDAEKRIK